MRVADLFLAVAILGLLALVATKLNAPGPVTRLAGTLAVIDGDTVVLNRQRLRLKGMDAPERDQQCSGPGGNFRCGETARDALVDLIGHQPIRCEGSRTDRYRRLLVTCFNGQVDLGASMVSEGWAVAYGGYSEEESRAKAAGVGLWAGTFEQPQEWRRTHGDMDADGLVRMAVESISNWFSRSPGSGQ